MTQIDIDDARKVSRLIRETRFNETKAYLDSLSLTDALWWFIENVNDDAPNRNSLFFYLRARVKDASK